MVSESLKLTFNLLTVNWLLNLPSLWLGDVIFSELECVFLKNKKIDLREIFFRI